MPCDHVFHSLLIKVKLLGIRGVRKHRAREERVIRPVDSKAVLYSESSPPRRTLDTHSFQMLEERLYLLVLVKN